MASNPDRKPLSFMQMIQNVTKKMRGATDAFTISKLSSRIVKLYMAPTGYMIAALRADVDPTSMIFSLPLKDGEHAGTILAVIIWKRRLRT